MPGLAFREPRREWLFTGDTLFAGGCGKLFGGTAADMLASLDKLAALPDSTQVYCAHEYTLSNLRFAAAVEPGNTALRERRLTEEAKRGRGMPTLPSTIGLEKATNPSLRVREAAVGALLRGRGDLDEDTPAARFAALRAWKNNFQ